MMRLRVCLSHAVVRLARRTADPLPGHALHLQRRRAALGLAHPHSAPASHAETLRTSSAAPEGCSDGPGHGPEQRRHRTTDEDLSAAARAILTAASTAGSGAHHTSTGSSPTAEAADAWTATRVEGLLLRHELLAAAHASAGARRAAFDRLTDADREEIRGLVDHLTHSVSRRSATPGHPPHWIPATCRLATRVGLHSRSCELFLLSAEAAGARLSTRYGEGAVVPTYFIAAAVASGDATTLGRCAEMVGQSPAASGGSAAHTSAETGTWTASTAVMNALRVYCGCVEMFARASQGGGGNHAVPATASDASAIAHQLSRLLHLQLPPESVDDFFRSSVRLARYASSRHTDAEWAAYAARAAVHLQVFRHWCRHPAPLATSTPTASTVGAARWLTAGCLSMLLHSATLAARWDAAALYTVYVDVYFHSRQGPAALDAADDALVVAVLRYHLHAHQSHTALRWLTALRSAFPRYLPSVAVGSTVASLAADAGGCGPSLALWCLELLLDSRQPVPPSPAELYRCVCALAGGDVPNFGAVVRSLIDNGLLHPSEEELLHVRLLHCRGHLQWRPMLEALLADVLRGAPGAAHEGGGAFEGAGDGAAMTVDLAAPGLASDPRRVRALLSARNAHAVLLILQEGEHPLFAVYYRFFLHRVGPAVSAAERVRWAVLATVWCTTRAGKAAPEDLAFLADEVQQLLGDPASRSAGSADHAIPEPMRHRLESKWLHLRCMLGEEWWARHVAGRRHGRRAGEGTVAVGAGGASLAAAAPFGVARFLKKRALVRTASAPHEWFAATTWGLAATANSRGSGSGGVGSGKGLAEWVDSREVWSEVLQRN